MKKVILIAIAAIIIIKLALLTLFADSIAIFITKNRIEKLLPGSKVTIGRCVIRPVSSIVFSNIVIKKDRSYEFAVKKAGIKYDIGSLTTGKVTAAYLDGADIAIDMPDVKLSDVGGKLGIKPGRGAFRIGKLDVSNAKFNFNTRDIDIVASLSVSLDMQELFPEKIGLKVDRFSREGLKIEGVRLEAVRGGPEGVFSITAIKYNKVKIGDISGRAALMDNKFSVADIDGKLFNGSFSGTFTLTAGSHVGYVLELQISKLDAGQIAKDMGLAEKLDVTGQFKGQLILGGEDRRLETVKGAFVAGEEGGMLIIKDEEILRSIAERTKQPIEIIRESFKDYAYNKGSAQLSLEGKDLRLGMALEGEKGKRDIDVIVHELK